MTPRQGRVRYLLAGAFHKMAFTDWGDPAAPVVVCVHGLTRNGRDFDPLAAALADRFRVVCPDLPGRGASDWLPDPGLYQPGSYVQALAHLLAALGGGPVGWVGTSLGGICGMLVAATPCQPITRMVLNDIGPHIPAAALLRIRDYVGTETDFVDLAALEAHLRRVHAPFGALSDAQWAHLAHHSSRPMADGRVAIHYDPAIGAQMRLAEPQDVDLWPVWDRIDIPVLAIRGASSDLLLPEVFERMRARAEGMVVAGAGHAPALMDAGSIAAVRGFLEAGA